jgi:KDO2-lipid IV(A) lauroyltransferase
VKVRLADRAVYLLGRAAIGAAARVPQWLGYGAASALGRLYFRCSRRRRACALRFLRAAYPDRPEAELLRLGRIATGNVFKVPIDMAKLTRLLARGGDVRSVVDVSALDGLLPRTPYLAVTAHVGSWEMAAATMARLAGRAHGIARVFKNPLLQRWILANRERGGLHIHPRRGGLRGLAAGVAAGAVGLQVVDQHQRLRGVVAPFFGRPASCERAAATLALRCSYPVVVGGAVRVGGGFRFRMVSAPPFVPAGSGARAEDLQHTVAQINERLEWLIRTAPEQYLWIHDRYRASAEATVAAHRQVDDADLDDGE